MIAFALICIIFAPLKMIELLRHMFKRAWELVVSSSTTWDVIAAEKSNMQMLRKQYIYPLTLSATCISFVFHWIYASERAFETAFLCAVITGVSLLGGYFIINFACLLYLQKTRPDLANKTDCETVVAYSYTVILLIEIITTIIPSFFFFKILNMFTAYLVWEGCRAVWLLKDEERGNIVLVFSLVLIFTPVIIGRIMHWMLPNI